MSLIPDNEKPASQRILTGDRPTGNLHIGHYIGSLKNRLSLQKKYDTYIIIADVQALSTHFNKSEILRDNVIKVLACYLAVGIDPEHSTIFLQSKVPEIPELTLYFGMITSVASLQQNPTIKSEIKAGYASDLSYGFLGYPVNQAADIAVFKANLVPVGIDQVPHVELTRKIVRKFNQIYGTTLIEPEAKVGDIPTLPGLDGCDKMSKSLGNAIYLCDSNDEIQSKIKKAKTDPARLHVEDAGHPDVCTIFKYYSAFFQEHLIEITDKCTGAKWGCGHCKKRITELFCDFITPIREKYFTVLNDKEQLLSLLLKGTEKARITAAETMKEVRTGLCML